MFLFWKKHETVVHSVFLARELNSVACGTARLTTASRETKELAREREKETRKQMDFVRPQQTLASWMEPPPPPPIDHLLPSSSFSFFSLSKLSLHSGLVDRLPTARSGQQQHHSLHYYTLLAIAILVRTYVQHSEAVERGKRTLQQAS